MHQLAAFKRKVHKEQQNKEKKTKMRLSIHHKADKSSLLSITSDVEIVYRFVRFIHIYLGESNICKQNKIHVLFLVFVNIFEGLGDRLRKTSESMGFLKFPLKSQITLTSFENGSSCEM